jgi:hypothetical protein
MPVSGSLLPQYSILAPAFSFGIGFDPEPVKLTGWIFLLREQEISFLAPTSEVYSLSYDRTESLTNRRGPITLAV